MGAALTMVHVWRAAAPALFVLSLARTRKVCPPLARLLYCCGLVQAASALPSRLHSKRTAVASPLKLKLALRLVLGSLGPLLIVASGWLALTVQLALAGVRSTKPRLSIARTRKVWLPLLRSLYCCGLTHDWYTPPSIWHSKVTALAEPLKSKLAVLTALGLAGPLVMVVSAASGADRLVAIDWLSSVMRPARSIARTVIESVRPSGSGTSSAVCQVPPPKEASVKAPLPSRICTA